MTREDDVKRTLDVIKDKFGNINVVVNCAGIGIAMKTLNKNGPHPLEDFARIINVNTIGTFNVIRLAAQQMTAGELCNCYVLKLR